MSDQISEENQAPKISMKEQMGEDSDKYSEDSVDCMDRPLTKQEEAQLKIEKDKEALKEKEKIKKRIDKYNKEKKLDILGNPVDPEKTYNPKGNELDQEGNIVTITSPRTAKRNKIYLQDMKDRCKDLVPVSKKLIRKQFKDYKKNPHQFDMMKQKENSVKPQDFLNKVNTALEKMKADPELKREDHDYTADILKDKECLPNTMPLMDKYYKDNKDKKLEELVKKSEDDLQLEDYAKRFNNFLDNNHIGLESQGASRQSDATPSDLKKEDLKKAVDVMNTILEKYEGLSMQTNNQVQISIDRFVFDSAYKQDFIAKTWKDQRKNDSSLTEKEFTAMSEKRDKEFKKQNQSFPDDLISEELYKKTYQAILALEKGSTGVIPSNLTKYHILFQMVNEKYKETKANGEKDPRKKVWMKLRNWVQSDVKYKNFKIEPYELKDHDFDNPIWGESLTKIKQEFENFKKNYAEFTRELFDIDENECKHNSRDHLMLVAFKKVQVEQGQSSKDGSGFVDADKLVNDAFKEKIKKINDKLDKKKKRNFDPFYEQLKETDEKQMNFEEFMISFWSLFDFYAKIPAFATDDPLDFQILCNFEEDGRTGQRFLRVALRQLIADFDDDQLDKDKQPGESEDDADLQYIEIHAMKLFEFDPITQEFELQYECLYDVTDGLLDNESVGFTNDSMLCNSRHTYFWKKEKNVPKEEGFYVDWKPMTNDYIFQLYKHEMTTPTSMIGIQDLDEIKKYDCFRSWEQAKPVPNFAINCENIEQKDIFSEIDQNKKVPIEDLSIVFLQRGEQEDYKGNWEDQDFLEKQFVAVTVKCLEKENTNSTSISIYYLKDLFNPIITMKAPNIQRFQKGFFLRDQEEDEGKVTFVLQGQSSDFRVSYEFKEKQTGANGFYVEQEPAIFKQERMEDFTKYTQHSCKMQKQIDLLMPFTAETIQLKYYRDIQGTPVIISPLRSTKPENLPESIQHRQHEIQHILNKKFNQFGEVKTTLLYDDQNFSCECVDDIKDNILFHVDKNREITGEEQFFANKHIIMMTSWCSSKIHYWVAKEDFKRINFQDKIKDAVQQKNYIQEKIIEQFSIRNQTNQHDNYKKYYKSFQIGNKPRQDWKDWPNEYLRPLYMHKDYKKVTLSHQIVHVGDENFQAEEDFVFMDLGEPEKEIDQDGPYFEGKLSMIRLFPKEPDVGYQPGATNQIVKGQKLVKYHISYSEKKVIMFFLQRNDSKESYSRLLTGVYFFVVVDIKDLRNLAKKTNLRDPNKYLLQGDIKCTILKSAQIFEGVRYQNGKKMLEKQKGCSLKTYTDVLLHFDPVIDLKQDKDHDFLFPFIHVGPKTKDGREWFNNLAVIDLRKFDLQKYEQMQTNNKEDVFIFDPFKYITFVKINQFSNFYANEVDKRESQCKKDQGAIHGNQQGMQFTRCSNWQKNIFEKDKDKETETMSARFQFGIINESQCNHLEIRDLMITFNTGSKKQGKEIKMNKKWIENAKQKDFEELVQIDHVGLKYAIASKFLEEQCTEDFKENCFQRYLVPRVDDIGNFNGSLLMYQTGCYFYKAVKLMDEDALKCNDQDPDDQKDERYIVRNDLRAGRRLEGQWGMLINLQEEERYLMMMDGTTHRFKENEIWQLNEFKQNFYELSKSLPYVYIDAKDCILDNPQMYQYEAIDLNNDANDSHAQLETALMQIGTQNNVLFNRPGFNVQIVSSRFLKEVLLQTPFDYSMQLSELHLSQQQIMLMSKVNFMEVYRLKKTHAIQSYFQPKWILQGQSMCGNDYPEYQTSVKTLKKALALTEEQSPTYLTAMNAVLETAVDVRCNLDFPKMDSKIEYWNKMMGVNKFNSFLYDLNQISLIQKGLDERSPKAVREIYNAIINTLKLPVYQEVMMQDLPQLLSDTKIKIHDFLNSDDKEDVNDGSEMKLDCNIEILLMNQDLPFQGPDGMLFRNFDKFENIYLAVDEISDKIIEDDQVYRKNEQELKDVKEGKTKTQDEREKIKDEKQKKKLFRERVGRPEMEDSDDDLESGDLQKMTQKMNERNKWESLNSSESDLSGSAIIAHYIINFMPTIRKIKIDLLINRMDRFTKEIKNPDHLNDLKNQADTTPKNFNQIDDVLLADYFMKQQDNKVFYEQTSVIKLIDKQFKHTRVLYMKLLQYFVMFYFIPLCVGLFTIKWYFKVPLFIICALAQIYYFMLELTEIQQKGFGREQFKEYLNSWNMNDFSMPFIFILHIILFYYYEQYIEENVSKAILYNVVSIICMAQGVVKIMQYVRVIDNFGFLVQMMSTVFFDLIPFFAVFFIFVLFFGLVIEVMGADFENQREVYPGLPKFVVILIQIFRNSIGDISVVNYGVWENETGTERSMAIAIIWTFWFFNEFMMLIIILNFLIAEVSQTYDRVKGEGNQFLYKKKCEVNQTAFTYRKNLFKKFYKKFPIFGKVDNYEDQFAVIAFKCPKEAAAASGNDEFFGFTNTIAKDAKKMLSQMKVDLGKYTTRIIDRINTNKKAADFTTAQIENQLKKVTKSQDVFKDHFDALHKEYTEIVRRLEHTKGWSREQLQLRRDNAAE